MSKIELIATVAEKLGTTKKETKEFIETLLEVIKESLTSEDITITGFGKFYTKQNAARTGRNPATGETMTIPAKTKVGFKFSKNVAKEMNV